MCGSMDVFVIVPQVAEANVTEKKINEAREHYRPAAARASLLYFILNDLCKINPLYQFSLKVRNKEKRERKKRALLKCFGFYCTGL